LRRGLSETRFFENWAVRMYTQVMDALLKQRANQICVGAITGESAAGTP